MDLLKEKIKEYYKFLHIYEEINFDKEILLFVFNISDEAFISIYTLLSRKIVTIYKNDKVIKEIIFSDTKSYYFYFLQHISEEYFIENLDFYGRQEITPKILFPKSIKKNKGREL